MYHVLSSSIVDAAQSCAGCEHEELRWLKKRTQTAALPPVNVNDRSWRLVCTYRRAEREAKRVLVERLLSACARVLKWKWNHLPVGAPEVRRPWNSRPHHLLPRWIPCLKLHTLATANALRSPVINWRNWFVWGLPRGGGIFFSFFPGRLFVRSRCLLVTEMFSTCVFAYKHCCSFKKKKKKEKLPVAAAYQYRPRVQCGC